MRSLTGSPWTGIVLHYSGTGQLDCHGTSTSALAARAQRLAMMTHTITFAGECPLGMYDVLHSLSSFSSAVSHLVVTNSTNSSPRWARQLMDPQPLDGSIITEWGLDSYGSAALLSALNGPRLVQELATLLAFAFEFGITEVCLPRNTTISSLLRSEAKERSLVLFSF